MQVPAPEGPGTRVQLPSPRTHQAVHDAFKVYFTPVWHSKTWLPPKSSHLSRAGVSGCGAYNPGTRGEYLPVRSTTASLLSTVPVLHTPQPLPAFPGGIRGGGARPSAAGMRQPSLQGCIYGESCDPVSDADLLHASWISGV